MSRRLLLALALSCAALTASPRAEPAGPLLTFNVIAVDAKGSPVRDLKTTDLRIYDDGKLMRARKDPQGRNVFAGGFLGLDNIGVFDRSSPLPTGGYLDQADGTAWMAFYCLSMLEIALILTEYDSELYEDVAYRFLEHFAWITYAMDRLGHCHDEMWDDQDGFFYDLLHFPNGDTKRVDRSMVGLLPLCASTVFEPERWRPIRASWR